MRLGELLLQEEIIIDGQLQEALDYQKGNPETRIGVALVKLGHVDIKTIVEILAKQPASGKQEVRGQTERVNTGMEVRTESARAIKPEDIEDMFNGIP